MTKDKKDTPEIPEDHEDNKAESASEKNSDKKADLTPNLSGAKVSFFDLRRKFEDLYEEIENASGSDEGKIKDCEKLRKKIIKSAETDGDADAQKWLGWAIARGDFGFEIEVEKGMEYLQKSADQGHALALSYLADIYCGQVDVLQPKDFRFSRAYQMYKKGSDKGNGYADYQLARMYFEGQGEVVDFTRAQIYAQQSVDRGSPHGLFIKGQMHFSGRALKKDEHKAFDMFNKAMNSINFSTERERTLQAALYFWLGKCYFEGKGTEQDRIKGYGLIEQAASGGNKDAEDWIDEERNVRTIDMNTMVNGGPSPFGEFQPQANEGAQFKSTGRGAEPTSPLSPFASYSKKVREPLTQEQVEELLEPLDNLIGLTNVKKEMRNLVYMAQMQCMREAKGLPNAPISLHSVFMGPPGTGKTTVAKLLGEILSGLGYLDQGHVVEVDRSGLVGEYVGETAQKTKRVINSAMGGVLFIDEAYALTQYDTGWDFGPEAVSTLLKAMEDERSRFVVIAAGYTDEMSQFLASNTGFKSRFSSIIEFDPFKADELVRVFEKLCEDHAYKITDNARELLAGTLKKQLSGGQISISNARGVRDLFEKTIRKQARRIVTEQINDDEELIKIRSEDLFFPDKVSQGNVTFLSD